MRNWILVLLLVFAGALNAQERTHLVQAGETLYGISRTYNVTIEQLQEENPILSQGLKEGQTLTIPASQAPARPVREVVPHDTNRFDYYTVQPQQTLYSLTREWGITYERLLELNPSLSEGLKVGQILKHPKGTLDATPLEVSREGYQLYEVEPLETVYSLVRKFGLEEDEFYEANPQVLEEGLKAGQSVWIPEDRISNYDPTTEVSTVDEDDNTRENDNRNQDTTALEQRPSKYVVIRTVSGESWETLSAKYQVSKEELLRLNPELITGVMPNRNLIVPRWAEPVSLDEGQTRSNNRFAQLNRRSLKVAVVLPLFVTENDSLARQYQMGQASPQVVPQSTVAFDFFTGLKMAMDSLTNYGLNIQLSVYDTRNSQAEVLTIAEELRRERPDVVFGPLYAANAELLARELPNQWIVTPLSRTIDNALHNKLIQAVAPIEAEHLQLARWVNQNAAESNLIFVRRDLESESKDVQFFLQHLEASNSRTVTSIVIGEELINTANIRNKLAAGRRDVIIALDTDPVLLTSLVNSLVSINDTNVVVLSTSRLMGARTLEVEKLNRIDLYLSDVEFVDYSDTNTHTFIRAYRDQFGNEPPRFTYHGFDVGMYFIPSFVLGALQNPEELSPFWYKQVGVMKIHDFSRSGSTGALENTGTYMLHLEDFIWKKVF